MDQFQFKIFDKEITSRPTVTRARELYVILSEPLIVGLVESSKPNIVLLHKLKKLCPKVKYSQITELYIFRVKENHEQAIALYNTSGTLPKEWFVSPSR